jgi:predicted ATPase/DNA-binding SARP family transcriptional activator
MRLQTLGGLRLEGGHLRRPKALLLLAYLAVEGRQARGHLAELFWPEATDRRNRLSVTLRRLRHEAPGAIDADDEQVAATLACDAGELHEALARNDVVAATAIYRGAFLVGLELPLGVDLEDWVYATREHLADRLRDALLRQAGASAAHGDFERAALHAERAASLAGATVPEPDAMGPLADLLAAGERDRSEALRRLASWDGVEVAPAPVTEARHRLRPTAPATTAFHDLPDDATPFIGRDRELAGIADLFDRTGARLVTIHGHGGSGKTRLGTEVARARARTAGVDAVHAVPLLAATSNADVTTAIAAAIGMPPLPGVPALERVVAGLLDRRVVLLLDETEHLSDVADVVAALLAACPDLRLIVTSRRRLDLEQEYVWQLGGLALPGHDDRGEGDAANSDAVRLFLQRARRARADLDIGPAELPEVARICRQVEGSPLAIELAAVWLRSMTLHDVALAIAASLDALQTPSRNVAEGHRTMRAVFDRSWELHDDAQRAALTRLAVFRGGFTAEAAAAVADADGPMLDRLLASAMLERVDEDRYRQHTLLAQYARERLAADPATAADAERRQVAAMARLAGKVGPRLTSSGQTGGLDLLDADLGNLRAALAYAVRRSPAEGVRLAYAIERFWAVRGHRLELGEAMERLLATPELGAAIVERAQALILLAHARDAPDEGAPLVTEGLAIAGALGDEALVAELLLRGAIYDQRREAYAAARRALEDALERFRALGDRRGEAAALNGLGTTAYLRGNFAEAEHRYRASLELETELGNVWGIASRSYNLGLIAKRRGDLATATALQRQALPYHHELRDRTACIHAIEALACIASVGGRPERAARLWGAVEAERLRRSLRRLPDAHANFLADVAEARAQVDDARFAAAWARGRREGFDAVLAQELRLAQRS